jgi:hypothetical protein
MRWTSRNTRVFIIAFVAVSALIIHLTDWDYLFSYWDMHDDAVLWQPYVALHSALKKYEATNNPSVMNQWAASARLDGGPGMVEGSLLARWAIAHPAAFTRAIETIDQSRRRLIVNLVGFMVCEMRLQKSFERAFRNVNSAEINEIRKIVHRN